MRSPRTSPKSSPCLRQLEKASRSNKDPTQPKINKINKFKKKDFPHLWTDELSEEKQAMHEIHVKLMFV